MDNYITERENSENDEPVRREEHGQLCTTSITYIENDFLLEFGVDYLSLTIFCDRYKGLELYARYFMDYLGDLEISGSTRFYEERYINGSGFQFLAIPRIINHRTNTRFVFPGASIVSIPGEAIRALIAYCQEQAIEISCTRIDLRVDNCNFKPLQLAQDILDGNAKTHSNRDTLKRFDQPGEADELGKLGTQGMNLGDRASDRFLRVYDKHGFTRFELECKGDAAKAYFVLLYSLSTEQEFSDLCMGLFRDFIEVDSDYWRDFVGNSRRVFMKTKVYYDPTIERMEGYLVGRLSQVLGLLYAIKGGDWLLKVAEEGLRKAKENTKYSSIIHSYDL